MAALRNLIPTPVDFTAFHGLACSLTRAAAWRVSLVRCFRKMSLSLCSSVSRSKRVRYSRSASRTIRDRFPRTPFTAANRSIRAMRSSSMVIAIVFILSKIQHRKPPALDGVNRAICRSTNKSIHDPSRRGSMRITPSEIMAQAEVPHRALMYVALIDSALAERANLSSAVIK
jgi:hypothetical protein